MLKIKTKLLLRFLVILISSLLGQVNGFAQSAYEKIDISEEFKKIETYNEHIRIANDYHYYDQLRVGKGVTLFLGGLSGVIGSIVLFTYDSIETLLLGSMLGGVSIALIVRSLEDNGGSYYEDELEQLAKAKALFKTIPN